MAENGDPIAAVIERGLQATTMLTEVVEASVEGAKDMHAGIQEARRAASETVEQPQLPPGPSDTVVQRITLELDEKIGAIENDVKILIRPPPRKRTVWGGAHAVERGPTRPSDPPSPPKVYGVHAPSARRLAAMAMHTGSPPAGSAPTGMAPGVPLSPPPGKRSKSPQRRMAATSSPLDLTRELEPRLAVSASAGSLQSTIKLEHDGLTPGQRALGAKADDRLANARSEQAIYGPPVVPVLLPVPRTRRDASAASAAARVAERRQRLIFGRAAAWLARAEEERCQELYGGGGQVREHGSEAAHDVHMHMTYTCTCMHTHARDVHMYMHAHTCT